MRKQTIISLFVFAFALQFSIFGSQAQTYFNNDYKVSTLGNMVSPFADSSGYIAIGTYSKLNQKELSFVRLNISGDTVWTKNYGVDNYLTAATGNITNIGDTNFVFVGGIFLDTVNSSLDSSQIILFKIDSSGNVLWNYRFGDLGARNSSTDIKGTADGGYVITGWTTGWGTLNTISSFLLKVDSNGLEEWHQIYGLGTIRAAYSVEVTADNGYIMAGEIRPTGGGTDFNVIKTDSLGNVVWNKNYGTPERDTYGFITKYGLTDDYIVASALNISANFLSDFQGFIAKINGVDGSIVWADTLGVVQNGINESFCSNVIILPEGDIVGIGCTSKNGVDAWLVKYDGNGNLLWKRDFNKYEGNNHNYFWDVHQTNDNGFVICGDLTNTFVPEKNLWVLKLDSNGCERPNCTVGVSENVESISQLLVYPNPSNGVFAVTANSLINATIQIYNVSGQLILQKLINQDTIQINLTENPKGLYFYQIVSNKKRFSGKLIIQ